jgi:hypothetical protein
MMAVGANGPALGTVSEDLDGFDALLAADAVFRCPRISQRIRGRDAVLALVPTLRASLGDARYTDVRDDEDNLACAFRGRGASGEVEGVLLTRFTDEGMIEAISLTVRPAAAAIALSRAIAGVGSSSLRPQAADMPWWRQARVCVDIACGIAVFSFALWAAQARCRGPVSPTPPQVRTRAHE